MSDSSSDIESRARQYATARALLLERRLGFGRDGTVWATSAASAIKTFADATAFDRELRCYQRLRDYGVVDIAGHHVPQLLGADDHLLVIEMSIVKPPFLLDFAAAYLDEMPDFSPEVMEQWREEKAEQFGDRWPQVAIVLDLLRKRFGIHLLDIHPWNITFAE